MALPPPKCGEMGHCTGFLGRWNYPQGRGTRPLWRKANNFRELVAFLLPCVATIKLSNTKFYLDIILCIGYYSSHYVYRHLSYNPWWQNVYAASAARVVSRQRQSPPSHHCQCQSVFRGGDYSD